MKKQLLPLLLGTIVMVGCSNGTSTETPTKHVETINMENCTYYMEVTQLYTQYQSVTVPCGWEFAGAIWNGVYKVNIKAHNNKQTYDFDTPANGHAYLSFSVGMGIDAPELTSVSGTVTYWL